MRYLLCATFEALGYYIAQHIWGVYWAGVYAIRSDITSQGRVRVTLTLNQLQRAPYQSGWRCEAHEEKDTASAQPLCEFSLHLERKHHMPFHSPIGCSGFGILVAPTSTIDQAAKQVTLIKTHLMLICTLPRMSTTAGQSNTPGFTGQTTLGQNGTC